jgi:Tfp pilus assembly protein PilW
MVFRTTSTDKRRQRALTFVETMVATGIASTVFALVASSFLFTTRSFRALTNYVDLDQKSRNALDLMSRQIRRAHSLSDYAGDHLTFEDFDGAPLTFSYSADNKTLTRSKNGVADPQPLLTQCDFLQFSIFQRNPIGGTYDQYPTAVATNCKLVQLTWVCSRKILGAKVNTESVQSAKIVIRRR